MERYIADLTFGGEMCVFTLGNKSTFPLANIRDLLLGAGSPHRLLDVPHFGPSIADTVRLKMLRLNNLQCLWGLHAQTMWNLVSTHIF